MRFPPPASNPSNSGQVLGVPGVADLDHSRVEGRGLVGGGDDAVDPTTSAPPSPGSPATAHEGDPPIATDGVAIMRQRISQGGANSEVAEFISGSIRESSQRTYNSAWKTWHAWCIASNEDPLFLSEPKLANYLWFLYSERNLAASTLGVHRAAIGSLLDPLGKIISDSRLLTRFMRAVFLARPTARSAPRPTWYVRLVLDCLNSWGPIASLSATRLSWRTFALILLFSCRRIGDLVFLGSEEPFLVLRDDSVSLQLGCGLKQARPSHRSPVITLIKAPDESLCPVRHIRAYIDFTAPLRSSRSLFVTTTPSHGAAARITLRQWFAKVLRESGIDASPGSSRAAVASTALARGVPDNAVMSAADWASARTLYANYIRLLPASALIDAPASSSVQEALLN